VVFARYGDAHKHERQTYFYEIYILEADGNKVAQIPSHFG